MLTEIFTHYSEISNKRVAKKLIDGIVAEVQILKDQPLIGQIELALNDRTKQLRYLIFKSYKIIYWINEDLNQIEIIDIFDARQSPTRMNRTT
ncbi:type II toxin-antitoxin system RelE/ParE family toxin [Nonlabens antarcticus]|uniref:type II toxin-antitoxin system RelE/ParE family toxin n=1 Tax=Nonlabens antarcticus TaxID=392714 RepID=UPI001890D3F2|nr:type II toxin-antitoxin system RelE/ParE family toxin [Nonlabens antarcticus]